MTRVALLDFDVHHGNGTQACVQATVPSLQTHRFSTPFAEGAIKHPHWKPWVDLEEDRRGIFLAGTQGYGAKAPGMVDSWFYPVRAISVLALSCTGQRALRTSDLVDANRTNTDALGER